MSNIEIEAGKTYTIVQGDRRQKPIKTAQATVTQVLKRGMGHSVTYSVGKQSSTTSQAKFIKSLA